MALSICGNDIWNPKWTRDKKIGIAVTAGASISILLVILIFFTLTTIETKQKLGKASLISNNDTNSIASSASQVGEYCLK